MSTSTEKERDITHIHDDISRILRVRELSNDEFWLKIQEGVSYWIKKTLEHQPADKKEIKFFEDVFGTFPSYSTIQGYKSLSPSRTYRDVEKGIPKKIELPTLRKLILGFKKIHTTEFIMQQNSWRCCLENLIDTNQFKQSTKKSLQENHSPVYNKIVYPEQVLQHELAYNTPQLQPSSLSILTLGTHDEAEFCNEHIRKRLENKMGHRQNSISYDNNNEDLKTYYLINKKIHEENHDAYVVVVAYTYGAPLLIDEQEEPFSKRHHELHHSHMESLSRKKPIIILSAEPGSKLEEQLIKKCREQLKTRFDNDEELLYQDRKKISRLKTIIQTIPECNPVGTVRANLRSIEQLESELESSLISITNTKKLLLYNQSRPVQNFTFTEPKSDVKHLEETRLVYRDFKKSSKKNALPGFCLLIHGKPASRINAVAAKIKEENFWPAEVPTLREFTTYQDNCKDVILKMLWSNIETPTNQSNINNFEKLAEALIASNRPCMLVLKNLGITFSLKDFIEDIWQPLYSNIANYISVNKTKNRWAFLNIVITYNNDIRESELEELCDDKKTDYKKYIRLTEVK